MSSPSDTQQQQPLTTNLHPPNDVEHTIQIYGDGNYARLTHGITFYQLFESVQSNQSTYTPRLISSLDQSSSPPQSIKVALCLHGIVWWSVSYHRLVQSMIDQGYHVLLIDFYGRGRSDSPSINKVQYNLDLFMNQAIDLLNHLHIEKVYLFGYSMGGAVSTLFTATYPQKVVKLCLLGPAIIPVAIPFIAKLITYPIIGKFLFDMVGANSLITKLDRERFANDISDLSKIDPLLIDDLIRKVKWQIQEKPGYLDAFHNTLYNVPFQNGFLDILARVPNEIPLLVILGEKDMIIPYTISREYISKLKPHAMIESVDCGHAFSVESPVDTASIITKYLKE